MIRLTYIDKLLPVLVSSQSEVHTYADVRSAVVLTGNRKFQGGTRPGIEKKIGKISAQHRSLEIRERLKEGPVSNGNGSV